MSQQPYQQPGQPGQPGGYQQPGYPQGGYQQGNAGYPAPSRSGGGNPLNSAAGLAPILQILAYVVAGLALLGGIFAFTIDYASGSQKFFEFCQIIVLGAGLAGILLALSVNLKSKSSSS